MSSQNSGRRANLGCKHLCAMLVFRYLNEEFSLRVIQERRLKVGRLGELNDPADCLPTFTNAPPQPDDEAREAFERRYFSEIYGDIGIVCFSATVTDPVIWSHYADAHRGMAVGYDFDGTGAKLIKVEYDDGRPSLDYAAMEASRKADPSRSGKYIENVVTNGFSKKALSWKYEQEHRLFVNLAHCEMIGPHYFLSGMCPNYVVLGLKCRISESDIFRIVRDGSLHGRVTKAKLNRSAHVLTVDFPSTA